MIEPRPLKAFLADEAERTGVGSAAVWRRMRKGWYGRSIITAYANARVVYVLTVGPLPTKQPPMGWRSRQGTWPSRNLLAAALNAAACKWLINFRSMS